MTSHDTALDRRAPDSTPPPPRRDVAWLLGEVFAPWVLAAVMPVLVGAATGRPWWRGGLLGLMVAVLSAGIPYLVILHGVRRGSLTDRHVSRRRDRPVFLALVVALVVVSLLLLLVLDAPRALVGLVVVMVACAGVGGVVSLWWKLSMHTVVLAASIVVLAFAVTPWLLVLAVAVVAVGWARVHGRSHTPGQAAVGAFVGAGVAAVLMAALT